MSVQNTVIFPQSVICDKKNHDAKQTVTLKGILKLSHLIGNRNPKPFGGPRPLIIHMFMGKYPEQRITIGWEIQILIMKNFHFFTEKSQDSQQELVVQGLQLPWPTNDPVIQSTFSVYFFSSQVRKQRPSVSMLLRAVEQTISSLSSYSHPHQKCTPCVTGN